MSSIRNTLPAVLVATGAVAVMLVDCGGGGSHGTSALPPSPVTNTPAAAFSPGPTAATATLSITVPNQVATTDAKTRKLRYVSPATMSISVSAALPGQLATAPTVLAIANISSSSTSCSPASTAGSGNYGRSCTVSVPIPYAFTTTSANTPSVDLDVATFDVPPSGVSTANATQSLAAQNTGTLLSEGKLLGQTVVRNTANVTLPIVLSGNVSSVTVRSADTTTTPNALYVPALAYTGNTATSIPVPVAITAKDVNQNVIIGTYLQPIAASLGGANPNVGLAITNSVVASPGAVPTPMPTALATTIASSSDQFDIFTTGEGFLYAPLTIAPAAQPAATFAVLPDNPAIYNEYDQYDRYDNTLLQQTGNGGAPWQISPETVAADTAGNVYYTATYTGFSGYFGALTFTPGAAAPTATTCVINSAAPPFGAMAPQIVNGSAYFVDNNGQLWSEPTASLTAANNGNCANQSPLATLPFGSGSAETAVSMTLAYDGSTPEIWIASNAGYLYAWIPAANAFRQFGNNDGSLHPWINVDTSYGLVITPPVITALSAFDDALTGSYLPSFAGTGTGLGGQPVTQGIVFGDAANGGLDIVATQPTPMSQPSPPPIFVEGTPGPQHFANATVAFVGTNGNAVTANSLGTLTQLTETSGALSGFAYSQAQDAWVSSTPFNTVANGTFGPAVVTSPVHGIAAEGGLAIWGVGQGAIPRGLIRYTTAGNRSTVFPAIPNSYTQSTTITGAVVGADGRIWFADSANGSLYAFPGYGRTVGNPNGSYQAGLMYGEAKRRQPATKH